MLKGLKRHRHILAASAVALALAAPVPAFAQQQTFQFNIPAQSLDTALRAFARTSRQQILFDRNLVRGRQSPALVGSFSREQALERLLAGSGLRYSRSSRGAYILEGATLRSGEGQAGGAAANSESAEEQIIVTGTHLAGRAPVGAPLRIYGREAIDQSGVATTDQFLRTLPENLPTSDPSTLNILGFAGIATEAAANNLGGAGLNIHGLGAGTTLTLLNGHRLAPSGAFGKIADVSMIPLAAIERIDVLSDGASAIYGADAIGGVVNFITSRDFNGAETRLHAGFGAGGDRDLTASQSFGRSWGSGGLLLAASFQDQTPLRAGDRSFIRTISRGGDVPDDFMLSPDQQTFGLLASVSQNVAEGLSVQADGSFGRRELAFSSATAIDAAADIHSLSHQLNFAGGATYRFGAWRLDLDELYARQWSRSTQLTFLFPDTVTPFQTIRSVNRATIWQNEARLQGALFNLPAGPARLLVGGTFRRDTANLNSSVSIPSVNVNTNSVFASRRDITSLFGELVVPIISEAMASPIAHELTLSVAQRYDHYSDFGSTNNPRIGLSWSPVAGLSLRGTYGTSFRAPDIAQLDGSVVPQVIARRITDPAIGQLVQVLFVLGATNPDVGPETSRSFTLGVDLRPPGLPGLTASATYYDISYRDRLVVPRIPNSQVLQPQFADFVTRNPGAGVAQTVVSSATARGLFTNLAGPTFSPALVAAIYNGQLQNIAAETTHGLDVSLGYRFALGRGFLNLGLDGTYVFALKQRATPSGINLELADTPFNIPDLRLRARLGWSTQATALTLFVNHVGAYRNNQVAPIEPVDSWTTLDLYASYRLGGGSPLTRGLRASLSIQNLLNADPPLVRTSPTAQLDFAFDPVNASARGRVVAFTLSKDW